MSDTTAARGTLQQLAARGCFMVSAYTITVILARELGPAVYGVYGLVMSVLLWVELGATAGIPGAMSRLLPHYERTRAAEFENTAFALLLAISGGLFAICCALAPFVAHLFRLPGEAWLFRLAFLDIPIYAVYIGYQGMLNGYRHFGKVSLAVIAYSCTKLAGIVLVWTMFELTAAAALLVNVLASVGGVVFLVFAHPPRRASLHRDLVRPILQAALPLGLILASRQVLLTIDLWALKSLGATAAAVGLYIAAANLPKMLLVIPNTIGNVLFSSLARALANHNAPLAQTYIQATVRFVLLAMAPSCAILAVYAEESMTLIYSDSYAGGAGYLQLLLLAALVQSMFGIFLDVLGAAGHYAQSLGTVLALIPLALLLNEWLIPLHGGLGAASALLAINCIGVIIAAIFVYRRYGALARPLTVLRVATATGAVWLLGMQLTAHGVVELLTQFALLGAIYLALLALMREISWRDLRGFAIWRKNT